MFLKACVIGIFVIGVALADPVSTTEAPSVNSLDFESLFDCELPGVNAEKGIFKYDLIDNLLPEIKSDNVETHIHLIKEKTKNVTKHAQLEAKWKQLKTSVHNVFTKINIFKKHSHNMYSSVKNKTMHLLNETHVICEDIVIRGKKSYAEFEVYKTQLKRTLKTVEEDSEKIWKQSEEWLNEIEDDVEQSRVAKAANTVLTVTGLKQDWQYLHKQWLKIHNDVVSLCTTVSDSLEKIENSTKVLYRNVTMEMSEIKTNIVGLVDKATEEYEAIIDGGKETVEDFKKIYKDIVTMFDDLEPMIGLVFDDVKDLLVALDDALDNYLKKKLKKLEKEIDVVLIDTTVKA